MDHRPDSITGKPRKVKSNGETWSYGLGRLCLLATGFPIHPNLSEWMNGFPNDWTALEVLATPLSPKSPNGSGDE
jgi:hypothetical protein